MKRPIKILLFDIFFTQKSLNLSHIFYFYLELLPLCVNNPNELDKVLFTNKRIFYLYNHNNHFYIEKIAVGEGMNAQEVGRIFFLILLFKQKFLTISQKK
jgi:hypothetical protein